VTVFTRSESEKHMRQKAINREEWASAVKEVKM
jgi:hypothetical protein